MKKLLSYILPVLLLGGMVFTSCDDLNDPILYDQIKVGFENSTSTASVDVRSTEDLTVEVPIMLIGEHQSSDVTITVEADLMYTTALPGTMYELVNPTVTIPAGESYGILEVQVNRDGFVQAGEEYQLELLILESSIDIAPNFNRNTMTIKTIKPYDINDFIGTYTVNEVDDEGTAIDPYNITTALYGEGEEVDTILVSGLWDPSSETIQVLLNKTDNTVTIPEQNIYNTTYDGAYLTSNIMSLSLGTVTGTFENGGGPIIIDGYLCLIQDPPYEGYNWLPAIAESVWTKNASKKGYSPNYVEKRIAY